MRPEHVLKDLKTAEKLFPDKKKILHFMQPHNPFIESDIDFEVTGFSKYMAEEDTIADEPETEWDLARKGKISREKVEQAFRQNTEFIINYLKENSEEFQGKTIITADHGNLVGEKGFYGHPGLRKEVALRKVPWVTLSDLDDAEN